MKIENKLNQSITLSWQHNGMLHTRNVPSLGFTKTSINFDMSKPGAAGPVKFIGIKENGRERVDLNGLESISIIPSVDRHPTILAISRKSPESFITINFINNQNLDAYVSWTEGDAKKSLLIPKRSSRYEEIRFHGKRAGPIAIGAVTEANGIEQRVSLNGSETKVLYPRKEKVLKTLVIGKKMRFLSIEFENHVAGSIILSWKIGNDINEMVLLRGENKSLNLLLDEKRATVVFRAALDGLLVDLNGEEALQLTAAPSRKIVNRVVASKIFRMDVKVQNNAADDAVLSWNENGAMMTKDVAFGSTDFISIFTKGRMADKPIAFRAILKEKRFPILLNDQVVLELKPEAAKRIRNVVLSSFRLELINRASSDVLVQVQVGPDMEMLKVPFGSTKVKSFDSDFFTQSMRLSGHSSKTNRNVRFNDLLNFEVSNDSNMTYTQIVITDGK